AGGGFGGSDYQAAVGTLTFAAGQTTRTVTVLVNGDVIDEPDETFVLNLTGAANATLGDDQGQGTILDDDHAPVANDDAATTDEDTPVRVNVLANDTDPDDDHLTVIDVKTSANGSAVINADGTVTYTPGADFNGTDRFTYTIYDGRGYSAEASVTVTVNPVNDAPVARDDSAALDEDTALRVHV